MKKKILWLENAKKEAFKKDYGLQEA